MKSNKSNMSFSLSLPPFLIASVSLLSPSPNRLHKLKTEFQKSNKVFIEKVFGFFQFKKPEFKETHPFFSFSGKKRQSHSSFQIKKIHSLLLRSFKRQCKKYPAITTINASPATNKKQ